MQRQQNTVAAIMAEDKYSLNMKNCLNIPDDFKGHDHSLFAIPAHYQDSVDDVIIPSGLIQDRIDKIATDIFNDIVLGRNEPISAVCVLKGGYRFFTDVLNKMTTLNTALSNKSIQISVDFIRLKSYQDDRSSGEVQIIGIENLNDLKNKNVVIFEDIIDTGKTMNKLLNTLNQFEPKSVAVATLLRKRTHLSNGYRPDYVCFEIPDRFVVGYALDYNEYFRDLDHICEISQVGKEKYKSNKPEK